MEKTALPTLLADNIAEKEPFSPICNRFDFV